MLALTLAAILAVGVFRNNAVFGLSETYRLLIPIVLLMPALVLVSTMHPTFDTEAYLADRSWQGALSDGLGVLMLATAFGVAGTTAALAFSLPLPLAIGAVAAYIASVISFRRHNDAYYENHDEVGGVSDLLAGDDEDDDAETTPDGG
jgi:hypothetical protein